MVNSRTKKWIKFISKRLALLVVLLLLITSITFFVTRFLGTPVYLMVGVQRSEEILESTREQMGLDKPLLVQYYLYLKGLLQGDFGISRFTYNPVIVDLKRKLPATLELATISMIFTSVFGIVGGIIAAVKKNSWVGKFLNSFSSVGVSVARFWLALMLIYLLYFKLGIAAAPTGRIATNIDPPAAITGFYLIDSLVTGNMKAFSSTVSHLFLPVLTLVFTTTPYIFKLVYSDTVEVLKSSYIQNARAFGLTQRTIYRYVVKNIAPSLLTLLAVNYAWLISADIVVEKVFSWPGIGLYAIDAMHKSDYAPVLTVVLLAAVIYTFLYFLVDILSLIIDPRWDVD